MASEGLGYTPEGASSWQSDKLTHAELSPVVGSSESKLEYAKRVFRQEEIDYFKEIIQARPGVTIEFIRKLTGDNPQEFILKALGTEGLLGVRLISPDWESVEALRGTPLEVNFNGQLWRATSAEKWRNGEPIAEVGKDVEAGQPFAYAMAGKSMRWLYRLPAKDFPKGAKILGFSPDFSPETGAMNVQKGMTVAWVEKK